MAHEDEGERKILALPYRAWDWQFGSLAIRLCASCRDLISTGQATCGEQVRGQETHAQLWVWVS